MDEWLSVQDFAPRRNPVKEEATAVKPWSFTIISRENILAFNIKKFRKKLNISQDRLSKLSDVTYNTIIKIESGKNKNPTITTLMKIADALGVSVDELIKERNKKS